MSTTTSNITLTKPEGGEHRSRAIWNANWDAVAAAFSPTTKGASGAHVALLRDTQQEPSYTGSSDGKIINLTPTWNTTGTVYGLYLDVLNTASHANSRLIDLRVGGSSVWSVAADGSISQAEALVVGSGGLDVTGNSTITGTLGGLTGLTVASGGATISGNSTIDGTLGSLTGLTVVSGGITVTGNSTITGTLDVTSTLTVGGTGVAIPNNTAYASPESGGTLRSLVYMSATDVVSLGGTANPTSVNTSGNFSVSDGSGLFCNVSRAGGLSLVAGSVTLGTTPASAGAIRLQNNSLIGWRNAANDNDVAIGVDGSDYHYFGSPKTQTTVGAAGGASALPATPTGYFLVSLGGTVRAIPFYAAS